MPAASAPVVSATSVAPKITMAPGVFGERGEATVADVAPGAFRRALAGLPPASARRALATLARLRVPRNDADSLHADAEGNLFYSCQHAGPCEKKSPAVAAAERDDEVVRSARKARAATGPAVPIDQPPAFHSKPGAAKVIYLDFNGETVSGTRWNSAYGTSSFRCQPYDTDGNRATFGAGEQQDIREIWLRVAEDYLPFDVDVTTEEPARFTNQTARALITAGTDANGVSLPESWRSAGVAFLDVFGKTNYAASRPAFVYQDSLGTTGNIADTVSHEVGHNLGLSHDGTSGAEYYEGHGEGLNSWAPIMGASHNRNLSQWSKGEYPRANNPQDDIAIIGKALSFRSDDLPDTFEAASAVSSSGNGTFAGGGVVEKISDGDLFRFVPSQPYLAIVATPVLKLAPTQGGNIHIAAELYDANARLIERAAIADAPFVYFGRAVTPGAVAYLRIVGTGSGNPASVANPGYSSYGSEGAYRFEVAASAAPPTPKRASSLRVARRDFRPRNVRLKFTFVAEDSRPTDYRVEIRRRLPNGGWRDWRTLRRFRDTEEIEGAQLVPFVAVPGAKYQIRVKAGSRLGRSVASRLTFVAPTRGSKKTGG